MKKKPNGLSPKKRFASRPGSGGGNGLRDPSSSMQTYWLKRQSEEINARYTDLYDFAPVAYVTMDRSGRIEEANLAAAQLFGVPRDRLIGMPFALFVWREDSPLFLHHLLRCRTSDGRTETELSLKNVRYEIIHAKLSSIAIREPLNGHVLFQSSIVDLTERVVAETALREKEFEVERIITETPFMLTRCTRDLRYRYVSRAYAEMLGHKQNDFAGKRIARVIGGKAFATIRPYVERVLLGETVSYEMMVPFKDAGPHFLSVTYVPDKNERGEVIGWIASMVDIGERKRAEERFRMAVEASPSGMVMIDQDRKITLVNSETERLFGYKRKELLGKSIYLLMPERFLGQIGMASKWRTSDAGSDLFALRKDGTKVPVEASLNPVKSEGKLFALVSILDITERKEAEAKLQGLNEKLERRVAERTYELNAANQELKSEMLRRKGLEGEILSVSDREQQRLGQELHDGLCQHLTAVAFMTRSIALRLRDHRVVDANDIEKVAELVNKAAIDTRNLSRALHRVDVDAAGLIVALQDLADREIWRTPCRLEAKPSFRIDDDAAAAHLYRIAREAVINANKHAEAREIVLRLERAGGEMVLRVIDDGVGLPKELKPQQGLGFHIMNYRAQLTGGRLEIDSPQNGGTRVSCYLPVHLPGSSKFPNDDQRAVTGDLTLRHLAGRGAANA